MQSPVVRREIRTTSPSRSIWQTPLTEEAFRHTAVDLALATNECPVDADVGLGPVSGGLGVDVSSVTPLNEVSHKSQYRLPLEIEHRLANDVAFIAATQEAVFSVTAVCVEELSSPSGSLEALTLRLAANEGISEALKNRLLEIWDLLTAHPHEPSQLLASRIFEKIIHLNRTRILQRARKAVGHPPIFREKGRIRTNPDDKLLRAFARMRKETLTPIGQGFIERATALNSQLLHLLDTVSVDDAEAASPEVLAQLSAISQQCFDVATSGGNGTRLPFKHLLAAAGLDQRTWLKNKHVVEIDKIGAYWRIARSLVSIHRHITTTLNPNMQPPFRLRVEGIQPYTSTTLSPSIQGRPMSCYVHAEVQLLVHYLLSTSTSPLLNPPPRLIGASKSACFLCYLFIRAQGGPRPPATHGRLYDQWTIPDLAEYSGEQVEALRQAVGRMHEEMARLRSVYCMKRPRDHPMTSRVDVDSLSVFTTEGEAGVDGCDADGDGGNQQKAVGEGGGDARAGRVQMHMHTADTGRSQGHELRRPEVRGDEHGSGPIGHGPLLDIAPSGSDADVDGSPPPSMSPPPALAEKDILETPTRALTCLDIVRSRLRQWLHIDRPNGKA